MTASPDPALPRGAAWQRWNGLIRLLAGAAALVLGLWGFAVQEHPATPAAWFNTGFKTLQLLTFQFPRDIHDVAWQLNIARFLLPLLALAETIRLVAGSVLRPIRFALLGLFRRPVLVSLGAGAAGADVVRQLRAIRQSRAAAGVGLPPETIALLDEGSVPLLERDPADPGTWQRLRADRARLVVIAHGDDIANLNAVVAVASVIRGAAQKPGLLVLLERDEMAAQLEIALDPPGAPAELRWTRLSPISEAVRPLFLDPPLCAAKADRAVASHIVLLGYGTAGGAILRQALTLGQDAASAGPSLTILAPAAETAADPLLAAGAVPGFLAGIAVQAWEGPGALPPDLEAALAGKPPVSLWCVCREDAAGLVTALALAHAAAARGWPAARIAVHQSGRSALVAALAAAPEGLPALAGLRAFGGHLPDGMMQRILDEQDDRLARHMHEAYQDSLQRQGAHTGSAQGWAELRETFRAANRAAAAHVAVKLAAIGCVSAAGPGPFVFGAGELEALAEIEHRRWCADRILQGWRAGPRDNDNRTHPDLVPFAALDDEAQQKDRDTVLALPGLLARMGHHIERLPETAP